MVMEILVSVILLFVGIAIVVIVHMYIIGRAFSRGIVRDVERGDNDSSSSGGGGGGLSAQELKKLPCFDYVEEKGGESSTGTDTDTEIDNCCAVCLEEMRLGDKCRLLPPCHHSFHLECVDSWLMKKPFCPICRRIILVKTKTVLQMPVGENHIV